MAKKHNADRQARIEQLRREQARKERRRSLLILGVSALVVIGLLAAAVIPYVRQQLRDYKVKNAAISGIGVSTATAGCDSIVKKTAQGNGQHLDPPTPISYPDAPPAFGKHWGNNLQGAEIKNFYTTSDRPQIERLVHSLEHGHTILWYDDTVRPGTRSYDAVEQISTKFSTDAYFMAAPWEKNDGAAFPAGKHVVLTHWTGPTNRQGVWQYCAKPSGSVVKKFTSTYLPSNSPEPGAP